METIQRPIRCRRDVRVYVAGPIQGPDLIHALANLEYGQKRTAEIFQLGFSPFPVFSDFAFVQKVRPVPNIRSIYEYSLAWLLVADAMLVIEGWEKSTGCRQELKVAQEHGIKICFDTHELCAWADGIINAQAGLPDIDELLSKGDD